MIGISQRTEKRFGLFDSGNTASRVAVVKHALVGALNPVRESSHPV
jgi:hypothetical protein